ncbi:MAG: hypothetical protein JWM99_679 [Verrucomicrobiales bacterium]|nr:hypothetical protein [Verrucomicrobiales bacterium]
MAELRETFLDELKDLYDAEKQLVKALPKMAKPAEDESLQQAFEDHLEETKGHVERLEKVFAAFDEAPKGKKCKAMQGLLEEGSELIEEKAGDAALICAAQKVEHYEIASYGSLLAWAKLLDEAGAAERLDETLDEEKAADDKLTEIAETAANPESNEEDSEEDAEPKNKSSAKVATR